MVKTIIKQIVNGLSYLKEKKVIHRDLHPGNILLNKGITIVLSSLVKIFRWIRIENY